MKKALKIICIVLAAILVIAGGYFAYVMIAYHRIGNTGLNVENAVSAKMQTGKDYTVTSYNIGFGAYGRRRGIVGVVEGTPGRKS